MAFTREPGAGARRGICPVVWWRGCAGTCQRRSQAILDRPRRVCRGRRH